MIYIYEDEYYENLLPLVYLKPVFDLYCGIYTFKGRIQGLYPNSKIYPLSRFEYQNHRRGARGERSTLFINGRAILHSPLPDEEEVFVAEDEVVGFKIKNQKLKIKNWEAPIRAEFLNALKEKFKIVKVKATVIKYPWDLIEKNECTIVKDFELTGSEKSKNLWIGKGTKVEEGAFFNIDEGPIYIGDNVKIRPPSIIDGPCYIGDGSLIDGAKIRKGTTIGKVCRIGGEVEESIFSDFSNKHHEGFVGHSFIGEWVNLGAGTTTSDLKNTYGTVRVTINGKKIDSRLLKVGAFIGDHTKTGIGTLLNTGSVVGCFVNIHGGGVAPKYIPSFSWGTNNRVTEYNLDKAVEVAKLVMVRRRRELTKEYEQRIRKAFELTHEERKLVNYYWRR